jgi:hypothetical protein
MRFTLGLYDHVDLTIGTACQLRPMGFSSLLLRAIPKQQTVNNLERLVYKFARQTSGDAVVTK